jgi:hypothetical protein
MAFAKDGDEARGGLLKNISASGCALEFVNPLGKIEHPFKVGQVLELEIDEIGSLQGEVMRITEEGIAVKFKSGSVEDIALVVRIMAAQNEIEIDE